MMANQKPDRLVCSFGAVVLLKHLNAINNEIEGVKQAGDIEYIHRMRVASRRFRNALDIFADCFPAKKHLLWQDQIRSITRALGAARDTDVQIFHIENIYNHTTDKRIRPGLNRLLLRLRQNRQKLQHNVLASLDKLIQSGVLEDITTAIGKKMMPEDPGLPQSGALYTLSHNLINSRLDELYSYEPFIHKPECKTELHAMRIAAKHLRYTLETFTSLYPGTLDAYISRVRKMQDLLGEIHDRDVWIDFLPQFVEQETGRVIKYSGSRRAMTFFIPGVQYLEGLEQDLRGSNYSDFLTIWDKWQEARLWPSLRYKISIHLPPVLIYPPLQPLPEPIGKSAVQPDNLDLSHV